LHSDNPWGNDKGQNNLVKDIPEIISATRSLLSWHFTTIRTPDFLVFGLSKLLAMAQLHELLLVKQMESLLCNE
jgi:hypothetical protein